MSLWTSIRDTAESIAPTAAGAVLGGPLGGALAGQIARPLESKSAQTSGLQKAVDVADIGLGLYGAYEGLTGGSPFSWGSSSAAPTPGSAKYFGATSDITNPMTSLAPAPVSTAPATTAASDTGVLKTMGKYSMPLAMGLSTAASMGRKPTDYTAQLKAISAPAQAASATLLNNYASGKLNPADQTQIDTWERQQIAQTRDFYARSGQPDSTAMQNQIAQIQSQAQGMRSQALQGMLNSGLQAIGVASGPVQTAIQAQIAQDQQMQQAQSQLFMTLAMFGSQYSQ